MGIFSVSGNATHLVTAHLGAFLRLSVHSPATSSSPDSL